MKASKSLQPISRTKYVMAILGGILILMLFLYFAFYIIPRIYWFPPPPLFSERLVTGTLSASFCMHVFEDKEHNLLFWDKKKNIVLLIDKNCNYFDNTPFVKEDLISPNTIYFTEQNVNSILCRKIEIGDQKKYLNFFVKEYSFTILNSSIDDRTELHFQENTMCIINADNTISEKQIPLKFTSKIKYTPPVDTKSFYDTL